MLALIKFILKFVLLFFILTLSTLGTLLSTSQGLNWLVSQTNKLLPQASLSTQVDGSLWTELELNDLVYSDTNITISATKVSLNFLFKEIFKKRLDIDFIIINNLEIVVNNQDETGKSNANDAKNEAIGEIKGFVFPFDIRLSKLEINQSIIIYDSLSAPIIINNALLTAEIKSNILTISQLSVQTDVKSNRFKKSPISSIDLKGNMNLLDYAVSFSGNWMNIAWPIVTKKSMISIEKGSFTLLGTLNHYKINVLTDIHGTDIPAADLALNAQGNLSGLSKMDLDVKTLGGQLLAKGKLSWLPQLQWDIKLSGENINPALQLKDMQGNLDFTLISKGILVSTDASTNTHTSISAEIKHLSGTILGDKIEGKGKITWSPKNFSIERLDLSSGPAHFLAHGELNKLDINIQGNMTWDINIPSLADLLPSASGRIIGKGLIKGNLKKPIVKAHLEVENLSFNSNKVQKFNSTIDVDMTANTDSIIDIEAIDISLAGQTIKQLVLNLKGPITRHQIKGKLVHTDATLNLLASGGIVDNHWQGIVKQLDLSGEQLGSWHLSQASHIVMGAEKVSLSLLCLQREKGELCVQGKLHQAKGEIKAEFDQLALSWLKPILPQTITIKDSLVSGHATINLNPQLTGKMDLALSPGIVSIKPHNTHLVRLHFKGGNFRTDLGSEKITVNLNFEMEKDGLIAQAMIDRKAFDNDPLKAEIQGSVKLQANQLGLLSSFVPQLEETQGDLTADLILSGNINQPHIAGDIHLAHGHVALPLAGIELNEINFHILADSTQGRRILIQGGLNSNPIASSVKNISLKKSKKMKLSQSDKGRLNLSGYIDLDAEKSFPAELKIKGEQVLVVNLPFVHAVANPDLTFINNATGQLLHGSVTIPMARMTPKELPSSTQTMSSDVVILDKNHKSKTINSPKFDMVVAVILGDDVEFSGYDFKANLGGHIKIIGHPQQPLLANGQLNVVDGRYETHSTTLKVEYGKIQFVQSPIDNPLLTIRTLRVIDNVSVGINIEGRAQHPTLKLFSIPAMPQKDILSYLVTGKAPDTNSFSAKGAATSLGYLGANLLVAGLGKNMGIDEIDIKSDTGDLSDSKVYLGKHVTENLTIGADVGLNAEDAAVSARYKFAQHWEVDAATGAKSSSLDVKFVIDIK